MGGGGGAYSKTGDKKRTPHAVETNWLLLALSQVDLFLPSETEAMAITRSESARAAATCLARAAPGVMVVVTCGKKGVVASIFGGVDEDKDGGGGRSASASESMIRSWSFSPEADLSLDPDFDSTGAGDTFAAGFLSELVPDLRVRVCDSKEGRIDECHPSVQWWQRLLHRAVKKGMMCAGKNCLQPGACNPPIGLSEETVGGEKCAAQTIF